MSGESGPDEGAGEMGRRVLASRGISPVRPAAAADRRPPPEITGRFVLGVVLGTVALAVCALVGAATIVWGAFHWLRGLAG